MGVAFWMLAGGAHAQGVPAYGIGDALKGAEPVRPSAPPAHPAAPQITTQPEVPLSLPAGETLEVRAFRFEGTEDAPDVSEAVLQAEVASYLGRALTLAQIHETAARITALYRSRGYLVARAYVPRQDASGGTLTIRVLVGRHGKVSLKNRSLVGDRVLGWMFSELDGTRAVTRERLERVMLLVDDLPGAKLPQLTISPGQEPGTSDFEAEVPPEARVEGYVLGDNYGSRYTGKRRMSASAIVNSPLGLGDRLSAYGVLTQRDELADGRIAYGVPLSADGLRGEVAFAKTTYELGAEYGALDATGDAYVYTASLSYPLRRTREDSIYLGLDLAAKRLRDEIGSSGVTTSKRARLATLNVRRETWHSVLGRDTFSTAAAGITFGNLDIDEAEQASLNRSGANTLGDFAHLNLDLSTNLQLGSAWSVGGFLHAQKALMDKNLDSSEQISLSGPGGVRAYRENVTGDNGYVLSGELRYALPTTQGLSHALTLFADVGRVYLQDGGYASGNGTRLADAGLGYLINFHGLIGSLQWAHTVGPRPADVDHPDKSRLLLQVGMIF